MADQQGKGGAVNYNEVRVVTNKDTEQFEKLLNQLQDKIRKTKRQYELWFYGTEDTPPHEMRVELDRFVRLTRVKQPKRTADQFRMAQVLSQYQTLADLWDKTQRKMEEGGKAPWMAKMRRSPLDELREANEKRQEEAREASRRSKRKQGSYVAKIGADGSDDDFRKVFNSYVAARKKTGDAAAADYEKFKAKLAKQTKSLIDSGKARAVSYRVEVQDGKVAIKAKAEKD